MIIRLQICFNFAFKYNLRRYNVAATADDYAHLAQVHDWRGAGAYIRPLLSST
jgi:hypothetical protein